MSQNETKFEYTLPIQIQQHLIDKKKLAAEEIEQLIKKFLQDNEGQKIRIIFETFIKFTLSIQSSQRIGGLWGIAAGKNQNKKGMIGLGSVAGSHYLDIIIKPILKCCSDVEPKVRYHACEALYNICKVIRTKILKHINEIFDNCCNIKKLKTR
jgi:vacuole morphology and inheritance protein 14